MLLCKLGYVTCFATIAFIGFYIRFLLTSCFATCVLVFYSTSFLLLSYLTMSDPCLIPFAVYLLVPACLCSRHSFQGMFMIQIYRYTCAYLYSPLGIHITTHQGVLTPLDPHIQVSELGTCGFSGMLIRVAQLKSVSPADLSLIHI